MFVKRRGRGRMPKRSESTKDYINPNIISHTSDEEMKHARSSNDDSYLSDEC
jgi:hypothetical protein